MRKSFKNLGLSGWFDDVFSDFVAPSLWYTSSMSTGPSVYLESKEDGSRRLKVALPGVSKENVSIELLSETITVAVKHSDDFTETFKYWVGDTDSIVAKMENGLLTVDLSQPKPQPKKIEIT